MKIKKGFVLREVGGKMIAVATGEAGRDFHSMVTLNASGRVLWEELSKGSDVDGMVAALTAIYEISKEKAREDVEGFVAKLRSANIIEE